MSIPPSMMASIHPAPGVRMILCADAYEANEIEMKYFKRGVFGSVAFDDVNGWAFVIVGDV